MIRGGATMGMGDYLKAQWNRYTKYFVGFFALLAAAMTISPGLEQFDTPTQTVFVHSFVFLVIFAVCLAVFATMRTAVAVVYVLRLSGGQRAFTYEFDRNGLLAREEVGTSITLPWSVVRRVDESSVAFRFYIRPMRAFYFPKRAFDVRDLPALRALLSEKLGTRARLKEA